MKNILVIKHGSLGDIVFALPVMHSIRKHFPNASITVLTEKKYFDLLSKSKYFNNLLKDKRSKNLFVILSLLIKIIKMKFDLIIDLQNSKRTSYYNFFIRNFGNSIICSSRKFSNFRYRIPDQGTETTSQGLFNQIKLLDIPQVKNIDYNWLQLDLNFKIKNKLVLFIPGVSKNGHYKQWDPVKFSELAQYCEKKKYQIYVIGTKNDKQSILPIIQKCKYAVNMMDKSPPEIIYSLSKISSLIITNDTGPAHIAGLTKKNILWLALDNKITKSNISDNSNNYKLLSKNLKNISANDAVEFIENNRLL